ncbi:NACHT domain-containing protein [Macrococcus caseolyticus]|uniref:NACHT domain-containing protein n=1 Tax=Macrococcoides caseolyticum TaxID=69966 RepID=UPI0024BD3A79|nr:NACHT domain-containing protein [Macrococcus caseolyticus]MDJ1154883.1 NACHT domain-containing protein [Macrococcus caseolyticus]
MINNIPIKDITAPYIDAINKSVIKKFVTTKSNIRLNNPHFLEKVINSYISKKMNILFVRTIINPHKEVFINDIYTDIRLYNVKKGYIESNYEKIINSAQNIIISGNGGMGKSMLLKKIFIDCISSYSENWKIPIYIELRNLIVKDNKDEYFFEEYILSYFINIGIEISKDEVEILLNRGNFIFLLDAMDEIKIENKNIINRSIENFIAKYNKNNFILTSRPHFSNYSKSDFKIYNISSLNRSECKKLIENNCGNENGMKRFIEYIESEDFDNYEELSSTPLMLLIMFKTFEYTGEISKVSDRFYDNTFMTMYSTHDNNKDESFKIERMVHLTQDEFEKIFTYFCTYSYLEQEFSFDYSKIKKYIGMAIEKHYEVSNKNSNIDSDYYIGELVNILCILIYENEEYSFIHRTFQEYYFVKYIKHLNDEKQYAVLNKIFEIHSENIEDIEDVLRFYSNTSNSRYVFNCIYKPIEDLTNVYKEYEINGDFKDFILDNVNDYFEGEFYFYNSLWTYAVNQWKEVKLKSLKNENQNICYQDLLDDKNKDYATIINNTLVSLMKELNIWKEDYIKKEIKVEYASSKDWLDSI